MSRQSCLAVSRKLRISFAHAVIIEDENEASGHIGLGCTVQIQDLSSGSFWSSELQALRRLIL